MATLVDLRHARGPSPWRAGKARVDKRATQLDAKAAASEADWAEADAKDAIDYAASAVDNARLAMLEAIASRAYADERAQAARA